MNCPNCNKEMKDKSHEVVITFFTGDEPDYYPTEWYEEYHCKDCRIKYVNGTWTIPNKYPRATDKQTKCVAFINRQLGTNYEAILKASTWRFIKEHIDYAKEVRDNDFSEWCEDNAHWLPEYF